MLARWEHTIVDEFGNRIDQPTIRVQREIAGAPLVVLKADKTGTTPLGNPFTPAPGEDPFFYVAGGFFKITVTKGAYSRVYRDVAIGTAAGSDSPPFFHSGSWDSATAFDVNTAVDHDGSSYICRAPNTDIEPGVDAGWEDYWGVLGEKGAPGETGPAGATGPAGPTGATGPAGVNGGLASPQGRLCLASGLPVVASDTSGTSIYYTPYVGDQIPIYDGSDFANRTFSELTLALDSTSGHTGYHQADKNFDLFVFDDSGTLRLGSSPAWTDDNTRANAISRTRGLLVNSSSIVLRFGSASGNTTTVAAGRATYVGAMRASADGTCRMDIVPTPVNGGTNNKLFLWNYYNRVVMHSINRDLTANWSYTTDTIRQMNNSGSNQIAFVCGEIEDAVAGHLITLSSNSSANIRRRTSIGFNSPTANHTVEVFRTAPAGILISSEVMLQRRPPSRGYNRIIALERSEASGTTTWYGGGDQELRLAFMM